MASRRERSLSSTSLGLPKDNNFHAKVLMSEYITVGHYVVQESRAKTGGWRYGSAPEWFIQGLQEYDGIFHTTGANRDATKAALFAWARTRPSAFACCSPGLAISDAYNGGATFMAFLLRARQLPDRDFVSRCDSPAGRHRFAEVATAARPGTEGPECRRSFEPFSRANSCRECRTGAASTFWPDSPAVQPDNGNTRTNTECGFPCFNCFLELKGTLVLLGNRPGPERLPRARRE
jgi:hypothetical protein